MRTSKAGLDLIKHWEGLRLEPYRCSAGELTIGYGHTGPDVEPGTMITEGYAEFLLLKDVSKIEDQLMNCLIVEVNQNQFDALISLIYNIGFGAFKNSTLLKLLNREDFEGASKEFLRWNKVGGKKNKGLVRRRKAEQDIFNLSLEQPSSEATLSQA